MATTVRPPRPKTGLERFKGFTGLKPGIQFITRKTGRDMLDRQARKAFGLSGEEFVRRYRAGETEDLDHSDVARISILIPFAKP